MLAYTPAELQAFDHDRAPPRSVWKELFPWRLWRPARYRRRIVRRVEMSAPDVNKPTRRSADRRSMLVGWLNVQSLSPNKIDPVNELVADCSLDVLALSETWHSSSDDARLRLAMPAGYAIADAPRAAGRGGGVAVIYRKHLKRSRITLPPCDMFKALCVRLTSSAGPIVLLNIYRWGSARLSAKFFDELASVLEVLVVHACPVIAGGDLNIHVHDAEDSDARRLRDLTSTFDIVQHIDQPAHRCGGTLDLVMTFAD